MHRNSPLIPEWSRLLPRMMCPFRTPSVVLHPSPQCVQMVPTCCISHGRVLYRYGPLVSAPTGHMSMHMPHSSHLRKPNSLGIISEIDPRLLTPSAPTPIPSSQ